MIGPRKKSRDQGIFWHVKSRVVLAGSFICRHLKQSQDSFRRRSFCFSIANNEIDFCELCNNFFNNFINL